MPFNSTTKSPTKRWNLATLFMPTLALALVKLGLMHEGLHSPFLSFFSADILFWLYPYLFILSYVHLIENARFRSVIMLVSSLGIALVGFGENSPMLTMGLSLYICFSLLL